MFFFLRHFFFFFYLGEPINEAKIKLIQFWEKGGRKRPLTSAEMMFALSFFFIFFMAIPVRTLTALAGLGLTGAGGYYFIKPSLIQPHPTLKEVQSTGPKYYDSRPFTLLPSSDIDARLRSGQFANKITTDNVKAIYSNQLPSNNPVEDNYSVHTFQNGVIAGVYDGKYFLFFLFRKERDSH